MIASVCMLGLSYAFQVACQQFIFLTPIGAYLYGENMKANTPTLNALRTEVENYLAATGIAAATFGIKVLNNPRFVLDLRSCQKDYVTATVDTVRAYMKANKPKRRRSAA